ncbi:MAG TPA: Uma2 family endonuclease [Bryobacteraceae bacterium]|nr:Uma2 family endonuclease [Bryobacteraceae bacterium]
MTFAEFEQLPDPQSGYLELHHGEVVLMPPRRKTHVITQQTLLFLLRPLEALGFLWAELPFRPAPEYESWTADIGFVTQARWDADTNDYFMGAPDLVIEVLSRSNTMDEILDRQDVCLRNGCTAFWVVDSKRKTILLTTPERSYMQVCSCGHKVPMPFLSDTLEVAAIFKR